MLHRWHQQYRRYMIAAITDVEANISYQFIVAFGTIKRIIAPTTVKHVVPVTTIQGVVAATSI